MAIKTRQQVKVTGLVQGVGFRPFIYRLALEEALVGWVRNDSQGVLIEVEGEPKQIERFLARVTAEKPPLARIEQINTKGIASLGEDNFVITPSVTGISRETSISPDMATCPDCLRELFDEGDRRYRYPFINCTNCGPRFTIIKDIPYDRQYTTMAGYQMCRDCQAEYENPRERRFHAEPDACGECGPRLRLTDNRGQDIAGDPVVETVNLLKKGYIVAIKGLGGYHLACDATNEDAVTRLRANKNREEKPLALMAYDLPTVANFARVSPDEARLLEDQRRPIVLLDKLPGNIIAPGVAPKNTTIGVMLPYTPLHYLILKEIPQGLVMTSGNHSSEPITYIDEDAYDKLADKTDYFLTHNREIYQRCDDSVARVFRGREMILRRSRGYTPNGVKVPFPIDGVLACGAELKHTFCLTKGHNAYLSHHLGDLKNPETLKGFEEGVVHFEKILDLKPRIIACDLHEDYLSTRYANKLAGENVVRVQHHHAHIAACMAENGLTEPVIGLSFDGTGLGTDGCLWGGEFLICDYRDFQRAGHLKYIPMPAGERAITEPWRMAAAFLEMAYAGDLWQLKIPFIAGLKHSSWELMRQSMAKGINAPLTSSMGRLFDGVSALLGICQRIKYEGQAAIELEQLADGHATGVYKYSLDKGDYEIVVDTLPIIRHIAEDIAAGVPVAEIAGKFHNTVADFSVELCREIRRSKGINQVALSGGVFQNILLLGKTLDNLQEAGFKVYTHSQVPPNDGGISLGQAVIAHERSKNLCV